MKRNENEKDRLKERSLVRKRLLATKARRRVAREILPSDIDLDQSGVIQLTRAGKKQRDRDRRRGRQA